MLIKRTEDHFLEWRKNVHTPVVPGLTLQHYTIKLFILTRKTEQKVNVILSHTILCSRRVLNDYTYHRRPVECSNWSSPIQAHSNKETQIKGCCMENRALTYLFCGRTRGTSQWCFQPDSRSALVCLRLCWGTLGPTSPQQNKPACCGETGMCWNSLGWSYVHTLWSQGQITVRARVYTQATLLTPLCNPSCQLTRCCVSR